MKMQSSFRSSLHEVTDLEEIQEIQDGKYWKLWNENRKLFFLRYVEE